MATLIDLEKKLRNLFNQGVSNFNKPVPSQVPKGGGLVQQTIRQAPQVVNRVANTKVPVTSFFPHTQFLNQVSPKITSRGSANLVADLTFRPLARTSAEIGLDILNKNQFKGKTMANVPINSKLGRAFYGTNKIEPLSARKIQVSNFLQNPIIDTPIGKKQVLPKYSKKQSEQIAPLAVGAFAVSNLLPTGVGKAKISKAAKYLNTVASPEDINKIKLFAAWVEKTKGGKADPVKAGLGPDFLPEIQAMARDVFGEAATTLNNKQLVNLFDSTLQEIGRKPNRLNLGLVVDDIRGGKAKGAQAGLSDMKAFDPNQPLDNKLYKIFNDEYHSVQKALDIEPDLMQNLPAGITGREALKKFDLPVAGIGQEGSVNIANRLKSEGYVPRPPQQPATTLRSSGRGNYTNVKAVDNPLTLNAQGEPLPWEGIPQATIDKFTKRESKNMAGGAQYNSATDYKTFRQLLNRWVGKVQSAGTEGTEIGATFKKIPSKDGGTIIRNLEAGRMDAEHVGSLHKAFDSLYKQAKELGIDIGYRQNYITHYWKQPQDEVRALYQQFKQRAGFQNERTIPTYAEGLKMGLTPRFTNPAQILTQYATNLKQLQANLEFFKELRDKGFIVPASVGRTNPGFVPISGFGFPRNASEIEGQTFIGNYYAPEEIAATLNKLFAPENTGKLGTALDITGRISGKAQDVILSGGVPRTPLNAFTIAQVQKEFLSGRISSPVTSFFRAISNKKSAEFFQKNAEAIKKMQERNVPVRSNFKIENLIDKDTTVRTLGERLGKVWADVVNEPTFARFMPMLQVNLFNSIEKQALNGGKSADEAADIAAKAVQNFYGLTNTGDEALRSKFGQDVLKTGFFAPKFREAMIKFWLNNIKAFKDPLALENRTNLRFVAGAALMLGTYEYLNREFNGHGLLDNPEGKQDKLLIPLADGTVIGIPYLSSIATIPRAVFRQMLLVGQGDLTGAAKDAFQSYASVAIKPIGDVMANQDYFGKEIVSEFDTPQDRLKKQGTYLATQYTGHPYLRELLDPRNQGDPLYQRLTRGMELPVRYYTQESLAKGRFYQDYYKLKPLNEQYEKLQFQDPQAAMAFYSQHQKEIDQFQYMKQVQNEYYDQKEAGKDDFSILSNYDLPEGTSQVGNSIIINDNGYFKRIQVDKKVPEPKLTGKTELDKELIKSYKSKIQDRINDFQDLYEAGVISAEEAEKQMLSLIAQEEAFAGAKKRAIRKITFKKSSPVRVSNSSFKRAKLPSVKLNSKAPVKLKPAKSKTIKIKTPEASFSYKVTGPSKIRGLDSSVRLV